MPTANKNEIWQSIFWKYEKYMKNLNFPYYITGNYKEILGYFNKMYCNFVKIFYKENHTGDKQNFKSYFRFCSVNVIFQKSLKFRIGLWIILIFHKISFVITRNFHSQNSDIQKYNFVQKNYFRRWRRETGERNAKTLSGRKYHAI